VEGDRLEPAPSSRRERKATPRRRFFLGFTLVSAALVILGFTRTFVLPLLAGTYHAPWFVYAHGALFFAWMGLLITQVSLVARHRVGLHRRLGAVAVLLVPLMIQSALLVAFWSTARDFAKSGSDGVLTAFYGEIFDVGMFAAFASLALLFRRRPPIHGRLILLATLAILGAAVGRVPIIGGASNTVTLCLTASLFLYDWVAERRLRWVTILGGAAYVLGTFSEDSIGSTPTWLRVGKGLILHFHYGVPPDA